MRRTPEDIERIMADTEEAMVRLRSPFKVWEYIGRRWKLDKRQVQRYMAKVRERWETSASFAPKPEVREYRRNLMRATLDSMMSESLMRTEVIRNDDGTVVLDEREHTPDGQKNPNYRKPFTRPAPDRRAALYAARLLASLDALNEPIKSMLEVTGLGERLPDLDSLPDAARKHLVAALEAQAPDGDLRKLAGELFASNARAARLN